MFFSEGIGEDTGGKGVSLEKNLNMNGEFIDVVGKNGLIEVELMPTPDERVLHS